jgi:heme/copper-type cytochrome/quinol oxidase subunit 3
MADIIWLFIIMFIFLICPIGYIFSKLGLIKLTKDEEGALLGITVLFTIPLILLFSYFALFIFLCSEYDINPNIIDDITIAILIILTIILTIVSFVKNTKNKEL